MTGTVGNVLAGVWVHGLNVEIAGGVVVGTAITIGVGVTVGSGKVHAAKLGRMWFTGIVNVGILGVG